MNKTVPTRVMRENPDIDQLKRQAKELLDAFLAGDPNASAEVAAHFRDADPANFALHEAQLVLARSYGFESWPKLKAHVEGVTAANLYQAVESGDLKTVRELLTRRPEIVDLGHGEMHALRTAVLKRDLEMTRLLLEFGANADGGDWTSPYVIARDRGYDEIAESIRAARQKRGTHGPEIPTEAKRKFQQAYQSGKEDAMVAVLDEYPQWAEMRWPGGVTSLHISVEQGALLIIKWLLDHGADVNRKADCIPQHGATFLPRSQQGWTPLDFAATGRGGDWLFDHRKFERIAKLLLEHGAELSSLSAATLGRWDYLANYSKLDLEGMGVVEAAIKGDQSEGLRRLLDLGLDPDEPIQVGHMTEPAWSAGGPLFQAVVLNRIEMARLLLERGADPNARVFTAGSAADKALGGGNSEMFALVEKYGGWIDPGSAGYGRRTDIASKMLAGEIDPHFAPTDFSGGTIAEQLLWGGASSGSVDIVRMALEHLDWQVDDPRWFRMLFRPLFHTGDHNPQQQAECCKCFRLILARCGPHHRASDYGQSMLHKVVEGDHRVAVQLATILLDAGARLDVRDKLLQSTPLGWACRWGRVDLVKLLLARGADPVEADAEPWATPRAWAERMKHDDVLAILREVAR